MDAGAVFLVNEENRPPFDPNINSPLDETEVDWQPTLTITNSSDPDGDILSYEFALYADANMTGLVAENWAAEDESATSWTAQNFEKFL